MRNFGLIGYPLGHSFSKRFFSEKFIAESIHAQFELYPILTIEEFPNLVAANHLSGLNVTIPYKEQVIPYLNELDEMADAIGAVNVIKFTQLETGLYLKGYNTDAIGFKKSIVPHLAPHHKKALILGTGGASKAINFVFGLLGIETLFVSRTPDAGQLAYSEISTDIMHNYQIIVNASPLGTFPNVSQCPLIPYELLTPKHLLFDVVYNPVETLFLKKARAQGAVGLNGLQMLEWQALEAWDIWNAVT